MFRGHFQRLTGEKDFVIIDIQMIRDATEMYQ